MLVSAMALWLAATPHLAVVVVDDAGQPKVADGAVKALGVALDAQAVTLGAYLKAQGPACREDVRCLSAAPELGDVPRFFALGLRELPGGPLAVDVRLVDRGLGRVLARSSAAVEKAEVSGWVQAAATRMIKANASAVTQSQFPSQGWRPPPPAEPLQPSPMRSDAPVTRQAEPTAPERTGPAARRKSVPDSEWTTPSALPQTAQPAPEPERPETPAPPSKTKPPSSKLSGDDK